VACVGSCATGFSMGRVIRYNRGSWNERASYNGSIEASQASDVGSIPIARSITLDDSIALTRLSR
jgi:hypothetical protein